MPMLSEQDRVESPDSPDRLEQLGFGRSFNGWLSLSKSLDSQEITEDDETVAESLLLLRDTSAENNATTMKMVCGAHYLPKDNPEFPLGEDAYFVSKAAQTIGVADGVGGWADKGIDAGEYARELMTHALISANYRAHCLNRKKRKARKKGKADEMIGAVDPAMVLKTAYTKTKENLGLQGSSTACILSFEGDKGLLHTANLGDSGFMVFRDSKMMFQSLPQQHSFNCPYQMSNGGKINDRPKKANEVVVERMLPGDTIVMGTDGLLDNIYPEQIEEILQATANSQDLASLIAEIALHHSKDEKFDSPFSRAAQKAGIDYSGGKIDDITVIVAQIVA